jgi:hypothetical protein
MWELKKLVRGSDYNTVFDESGFEMTRCSFFCNHPLRESYERRAICLVTYDIHPATAKEAILVRRRPIRGGAKLATGNIQFL